MAVSFNLPTTGRRIMPSETGIPDYIAALSKGMDLGYKPRNLENEAYGKELANKINQAKAKYAEPMESAGLQLKQGEVGLIPLRQKLMQAQASRQQQLASQPYGGNLSGIAREAYGIAQITGQDPKEVAQKLYQNKLEQSQALNDYRHSLTETAPKRASTQLAKLEQEEQEAQQGFLPGSNGKVRLSPDQQESLSGQYQLARQKLSSDVDTRKKLLYATNLDKTLNNINVDDLTQYSGIAGGLEKKIAEGKSLSGKEEKKYEAYQKSLTASQLLAKQVRQFYGDSITPTVQEKLGQLTNPSTWKLNPKVAKSNFNQFKSILRSETQTYRDALKGKGVYGGAPENINATPVGRPNANTQAPPNTAVLYRKGKSYFIPLNEVDDAVQSGGFTYE